MILEHENIRKIAFGQGDDYKTGSLLDFPYFKENYKMIVRDLSKQQALDADSRAIKKLISMQSWTKQEIQQFFSLLKKQKKLSYTFYKEL